MCNFAWEQLHRREVEALLNGRPLCYIGEDPLNPEPLTPFMLLTGRANINVPVDVTCDKECTSNKHWCYAQRIVDRFWHRWRKEYLPTLQHRATWTKDIPNVKVGDVVVIVAPQQPRGHWPLGRITHIVEGTDGRVRIATVETKNRSYNDNFHYNWANRLSPGNEPLVLTHAQFTKKEQLLQELLFARELVTDAKGKSTFRVLQDFFEEEQIPLTNIISVATDGEPSTVGSQRGFTAHLKQVVSHVVAILCVFHRKHLIAKRFSDRLNSSLQLVITAINRTTSCFNNCEKKMAKNTSAGACILRHFRLYPVQYALAIERRPSFAVQQFFAYHGIGLLEAYLSDLYFKFNEMNLHLQGDDLNLCTIRAVVCTFIKKLLSFKRDLFPENSLSFQIFVE
ncbi:LOW QUALITY PROTEIN: hypothetical protein M514_00846 [Trichuris suis]|nr:LOW QUALITY PROTEIN: hypothetical protein M514_00846 [Trichuris suis]